MRSFLPGLANRMPETIRGLLPEVTYPQFFVAVLFVTVFPYLFAVCGDLGRNHSSAIYLLIGTQVVIFINVFSHITAAAVLGGYSPGLVSAVAINLPFSLYLFRCALQHKWVSRRTFAIMFPVGLVVHGPGPVALMTLSGWIASSF